MCWCANISTDWRLRVLYSDCAVFVGGDLGVCDLYPLLALFGFKFYAFKRGEMVLAFLVAANPWPGDGQEA